MGRDLARAHRTAYDAVANEYEERVDSLRDITKECVDILRPYLPPGGRVLDIGCGVGLMVHTLDTEGFNAEGIELSPRMVAFSRKRNPERVIYEGDFLNFVFPHTYAGLTALAFIHLFPANEAQRVLKKMNELLDPRGLLYIGTTKSDRSSEGWEEKHDFQGAVRRFRKHWTETEFRTALQEAQFEILDYHELTDPFGKTWMDIVARKIVF